MNVVVSKEFLGAEEDAELVEWVIADGSSVSEGDTIAQLETSKLTTEFVAPASGVITFVAEVGDVVSAGESIASIA